MVDFDYFGTVCRSPVLQFGLRLRDGVPGVVFGVVLLISTVIRDAADDFFWVVSSREGASRRPNPGRIDSAFLARDLSAVVFARVFARPWQDRMRF